MKKTYTKERELTVDEVFQILKEKGPFEARAWDDVCSREDVYVYIYGVGRDDDGNMCFADENETNWLHCAIQEEIDPRVTPEGVDDLPDNYWALVPEGTMIGYPGKFIQWFSGRREWVELNPPAGCPVGYLEDIPLAIDVTAQSSKEHFPEIVACYPEYNDKRTITRDGKVLFHEELRGPQEETSEDTSSATPPDEIEFNAEDMIKALKDFVEISRSVNATLKISFEKNE